MLTCYLCCAPDAAVGGSAQVGLCRQCLPHVYADETPRHPEPALPGAKFAAITALLKPSPHPFISTSSDSATCVSALWPHAWVES